MTAREYVAFFENMTVPNAAATLLMIQPGTTCSLEIVRAWVMQSANATSAQTRIEMIEQAAALPTTLTAMTPVATDRAGQASQITGAATMAAGKCGINSGTTTETAGARTVIAPDVFNNVTGWFWSGSIVLPASYAKAFALYLPVAASPLTNWTGGIMFREL